MTKTTRQREIHATSANDQQIIIEKLKKMIEKLKKELTKKKRIDVIYATTAKKTVASLTSRQLIAVITLSTRNSCENFEIKTFIKKEEEVKKIMKVTMKKIVNKIRKTAIENTLSTR